MNAHAKPIVGGVSPLRGLGARVSWSSIGRFAEDEEATLCRAVAAWDAFEQGSTDYDAQRSATDVPPLLADVPALAQAWAQGWGFAAESAEMDECPGCQSASGEPCVTHG